MEADSTVQYEVIILGSGQDAGLPQMGSSHANDVRARKQRAYQRTGPSICVVSVAPSPPFALLIDASPDLRQQWTRLLQENDNYRRRYDFVEDNSNTSSGEEQIKEDHDRKATKEEESRNDDNQAYKTVNCNPFDAVIITHAHMGHYTGLVHFGREAAHTRGVELHCTESMGSFLQSNQPWKMLFDLGNLSLCVHTPTSPSPLPPSPSGSFELAPGLFVELLKVPHRSEFTDTVGVSVNGTLLYVPDIDSWERWPLAHDTIAAHNISLLDATFHSREELPGRDMKKITHPLVTDTIERFSKLIDPSESSGSTSENDDKNSAEVKRKSKRRRIILTHLNHSNPLCDDESKESKHTKACGFEIAFDMCVIGLV